MVSNSLTAKKGIDSFDLKLIAIFGMTCDHTAEAFAGCLPFWANCLLQAFGGLTFPIMAYLLCEGYHYTHNVRRYAGRLLLFALISELPFVWFSNSSTSGYFLLQANVLYTLFISLLLLIFLDKARNIFVRVLIVLGAGILVTLPIADWGIMGILMVLLYRYVKNPKLKIILGAMVPLLTSGIPGLLGVLGLLEDAAAVYLPKALYFLVGTTLTIPLLLHYDGKRGRPMKYLFYAYYPLQFIVLALLRGILVGDWGF